MADQFASSIIYLLHFEGANGSTTITDSSNTVQNAVVVGTAAISTAQSKIGGTSLKTGSANGNYVKAPMTKQMGLGSADFTLEAWVWPVSQGTSYGAIFGRWDDANSAVQDFLVARASNGAVQVSVNGAQLIAGNASDLPTGAWAHVAVTRAGTSVKVWINGTQVSSATLSGAINCAMTQGIVLGQGHFSGGSTFLEAYYDEFCITAACRYTATFTPPTTPYGTPDNTNYVLMLHGEGSTGGYPTDSSPSHAQGAALVGTGVTTSTAQKKFGNSSIAFDGTSSIQYPNSVPLDLSTNAPDWTIEFFVYLNAYPASGNTQVINKDAVFGTTNPSYAISIGTAGKVNLLFGNGTSGSGVQVMLGVTQVIPLNTWTHVAAVRKGTTAYVFVGGVLDQSATITSTMVNGTGTLRLGNVVGGAAGEYLNGYLDEVRITKGIGRYTVTFNPPTAQFLDDDGSFPGSGDTVALLHFDKIANTVNWVDSSRWTRVLTSTGTTPPTLSSAQSKFGGNSVFCSGNGYLYANDATELNPGANDFTIDGWFYPTTVAAGNAMLITKRTNASTFGPFVLYRSGATLSIQLSTNGTSVTQSLLSVGTLTANTWHHVALVRQGPTVTLYLNGVSLGTMSVGAGVALVTNTTQLLFGGDTNTNYFTGYLDEWRIINGVAAYTGAFTPPTAAYADEVSTRRTFGQPAPYAYSKLLSTPLTGAASQAAKRTAPGQTDATWGGKGRVAGQTTVNNTPTPQKVRLIEEGSALVQSAWSDANGNYVFDNINENYKYQVLGRDYSKTYNAVVQDNITPVLMPLYSSYPAETTNAKFRRKITMPQAVGLGANHTVLVRVGESTLTMSQTWQGANTALLADVVPMLKTFPTTKGSYTADIAFTDLSGNNLPYWLERVVGTAPNRTAFYWVNLGSQNLDSGNAQFYMVYNMVTPVSSTGLATFPVLFDDFTGGSLDTGKWTFSGSAGTPSLNGNDFLAIPATAPTEVRSLATFGQGYEFIGGYVTPGYTNQPGQIAWNAGFVGGTIAAPTKVALVYAPGSDTSWDYLGIAGDGDTPAAGKITAFSRPTGGTQRVVVTRDTAGGVVANVNDILVATRTGASADVVPVGAGRAYSTNGMTTDYIIVRKTVANLPALVIGYEEIAP
ncbi:DUF2341 domain-containing protein [Cupriavidus necator]|uniref:DUF2341 domain-containing protein n=1 Tax=Cupriavidus necator TaxID=106590 RepID=UPI00339D9F36